MSKKKKRHRKRKWGDRVARTAGKMTVRLFLLLILCGIMSIVCFRYLMQWQTWVYIELLERGYIQFDAQKIIDEIQRKAVNIDFEEHSEKELRKLLNLKKYDDGYTSLIFYSEDGTFQFYGLEPGVWDSFVSDTFWYNDVGYYAGLDYSGDVKFRDVTETIMVYSMHQALIVVPYFLCSLLISMLLFLPVVFYVWSRMRYVGKIKKEILVMADGDLEHPITVKGRDEIGVLARNLDGMRLALEENVRREQEGQKANHDLISSISHDLRTPMTTLYGYLEIIGQKKCSPEKQEEYIARCIEKVGEIRTLSDKMFEYALVYEKNEQVEMSELSFQELVEELEGNQEFLKLKGYQVQKEFQAAKAAKIMGNRMLFQRMFNNLFSNILKYGEKGHPVLIKIAVDKGRLQIVFLNQKRQCLRQVESNQIGLKSVQKMAELQEGTFFAAEEGEMFAVTMQFPLL